MGCTSSVSNVTTSIPDSSTEVESAPTEEVPQMKLLLLGAGESGKTTLIKQLKAIHRIDTNDFEIKQIKAALHDNALTMMKRYIEAAESFGLSFPVDEQITVDQIKNFQLGHDIGSFLTED